MTVHHHCAENFGKFLVEEWDTAVFIDFLAASSMLAQVRPRHHGATACLLGVLLALLKCRSVRSLSCQFACIAVNQWF